MDFADRLRDLASRVPQQVQHIRTEEATKNALVMPFIGALGYNVFDPLEVTPELDADVGVKKGEKVDYAVLKDGKPIMLFECKAVSANLDEVHASQLYRYFSVTEARIGVVTNGIVYRFFSDLEAPNKMDSKPFLEVNILALDDGVLAELKKFSKSAFEIATVLANASDLNLSTRGRSNDCSPTRSRSLPRSSVYPGRMTQSVREQFAEITKKALQQFISERVSDRLKTALAHEEESTKAPAAPEGDEADAEAAKVQPTEDELHGYYIVKAILTEVVDPKRVAIRDQKSYCSVLRFRSPVQSGRKRSGPSGRRSTVSSP